MVELRAPVVGDRSVVRRGLARAGGLCDLRGADQAGDLSADARGRVAVGVLPALLRGRALGKNALRGAADVAPGARVGAPELPREQDRIGDLVELQAAPVRRAVEVRVLRQAAVGLLLARPQ